MALAAGTRIGVYEIVAAIGAGGMGEVYRAHDTTLRRDVAIKVLPPFLANDADHLARFAARQLRELSRWPRPL
jgi:eukaryotic-like serine/threonine-protein kinase